MEKCRRRWERQEEGWRIDDTDEDRLIKIREAHFSVSRRDASGRAYLAALVVESISSALEL